MFNFEIWPATTKMPVKPSPKITFLKFFVMLENFKQNSFTLASLVLKNLKLKKKSSFLINKVLLLIESLYNSQYE